jgi:hypothetical protein
VSHTHKLSSLLPLDGAPFSLLNACGALFNEMIDLYQLEKRTSNAGNSLIYHSLYLQNLIELETNPYNYLAFKLVINPNMVEKFILDNNT